MGFGSLFVYAVIFGVYAESRSGFFRHGFSYGADKTARSSNDSVPFPNLREQFIEKVMRVKPFVNNKGGYS